MMREERMATVNIDKSLNSEEDAKTFKETYLKHYPTGGYGTALIVLPPITKDDPWRVTGYRSSSCD